MAKDKTSRKAPMGSGRDALMQAFREAQRPLRLDMLLRILGLHRKEKRTLEESLEALQAEGRILRLRGGAWGLTDHMKMVTGTLQVQRTGMGFVLPEDRRRTDIYVHPTQMGEAWHGDKVVVVLLPGGRGRNPEGRIVRILERGLKEMPARVVKRMGRQGLLCRAADARIKVHFLVDVTGLEGKPQKDDILVVSPGERVEDGLWAATAVRHLGSEDDVSVQERLVKINHGVPTEFPVPVLEEAATLPPAPGGGDFADRIDLRHMEFVTIDGARARDFDDAICVEEQGKGWRLWVAIADVSHYVRPGSAMDREALERSNSYYFPQSVEPMLPEALSNGLCSLNPRVPRLAMVAEIYFFGEGSPGKCKFYPAVIESKARLTYGQVNRALLLGDEEERLVLRPVLPMLEQAEKLARVLHQRRRERGSLDFDLPEPEIAFNIYGETVDIRRKVRHFGHQIVEEFMIAANEAVARFLTEKEADFLYRVHPEPEPEKLSALFKVLAGTDIAQGLPREASAGALQTVLQKAHGSAQEFLISRLTLRTMMQARYSPEHEGHFGLASACYCHFTSPIRRYADLVVHRALKRALGGDPGPTPAGGKLVAIADQLSQHERKAMEAEREILKRLTVLLLRSRVGETLTGVISSILDFGFFVELNEVLADGMVRLSSLDDDYYAFIPERQELRGERTGRTFRLGQQVKVRLADVNVGRLEVNLELVREEGDDTPVPTRRRSAASGRDGSGRDGSGRGGRGRSRHDATPRVKASPDASPEVSADGDMPDGDRLPPWIRAATEEDDPRDTTRTRRRRDDDASSRDGGDRRRGRSRNEGARGAGNPARGKAPRDGAGGDRKKGDGRDGKDGQAGGKPAGKGQSRKGKASSHRKGQGRVKKSDE
ncbi:ribonuclease R [Nitratidesulfovibrio vulgaris]|uniref:Ribonuclease R n=1 Tax=Nitratidesulfovibrio vulgaris (strain ATCC 29579 / DSM 644 / CCUG 34227 / NCIMB 8303 / VKM B-1760 / Hildenborough) TaxID=882 RepID=Q728Y5_NITV2|nr:ribonuclease R [Nitratidesulfovibrio vulgaris]AAS96939.1 ribonuclease R [Nitratidesulfovibrio vulgaris str. Hildenborough]ADP87420.1 ribonuclease R [Nitratidesulfovibrio vulgaris RCH1]